MLIKGQGKSVVQKYSSVLSVSLFLMSGKAVLIHLTRQPNINTGSLVCQATVTFD